MKRTWMSLIAVVLLLGTVGNAQARRGKCAWMGGPGAVFARLDLTEDQRSQIAELRTQLRAAMRELRAADTPPDVAQMQALRQAHHEKMKAILTQQQRDKLAALEEEFGERMWIRGGGKEHGAMGRWAHRMGQRGAECMPPEPRPRCGWRGGPGIMGPVGAIRGGMWPHPGMGPAPAPPGPPPGPWNDCPEMGPMGIHGRGGNPLAQLHLSDEQQAKLRELRAKHNEARMALRAQQRAELEGVLTKKQRKQLQSLKDEAFYGRGAPLPGRPPALR